MPEEKWTIRGHGVTLTSGPCSVNPPSGHAAHFSPFLRANDCRLPAGGGIRRFSALRVRRTARPGGHAPPREGMHAGPAPIRRANGAGPAGRSLPAGPASRRSPREHPRFHRIIQDCRRETSRPRTAYGNAPIRVDSREGFAPEGPRHRRARSGTDGARRCLARRGLGAVGNGRFVAYGARSPARSAAEGHAQTPAVRRFQEASPGSRDIRPRTAPARCCR